MRVVGVILAGGSGLRMGGADKALLSFGDSTLIGHCIARLHRQVDCIAISANGHNGRFGLPDVPVLPDIVPMGPLSGMLAGLTWAAGCGATGIVSVAVDTPFFPDTLVARLTDVPDLPAIALCGGRAHPTFGYWPVTLYDEMADALAHGQPKLMRFVDRVAARTVIFDGGTPDPFWNINTPQDLVHARAVGTR